MTSPDSDFLPIRVSTLRGDQRINFDVYVRVAGKFILYCRKGESFDGQRLMRLKEKKLRQMFIQRDAHPEYSRYVSQNIEIAYLNTSGKPIEVRCQIIKGLQEAATEEVLENPASQEAYELLKDDTKKYVEFLLIENHALKGIITQEESAKSVAQHSLGVASLAVSLAHHLGEQNQVKLQLLATSCLLHDIEHFHSSLNVARPLVQFTTDEMATYRQHTELGLHRVQAHDFYEPTVLKIVRSHHEYINGSGFPDGLKESEIDRMVLIASVADSYDRLIFYEGVSPKDAVKKLLIDKVGLHPLELIQGLGAVLKEKGLLN